MMRPSKFHLFSALPPEIQLQVWNAAASSSLDRPAMHLLDVNVPFPTTSTSAAPPLHSPPQQGRELSATTTTTTTTTTTSTIPVRHRPRLPRRSTPSTTANNNIKNTSQGRRGGRVRKRTPSPSRRNGICFDTSFHFAENSNNENNIVTLSALDTTIRSAAAGGGGPRSHAPFDPSAYKFREALLSTCVDSANTISKLAATAALHPHSYEKTTIDLPSGRRISYNNAQDVFHLRFVLGGNDACSAAATTSPPSPDFPPPAPTTYSAPTLGNVLHKDVTFSSAAASTPSPHPLSAIFQALWSPHLAQALHTARRIAIDISQIWPTLGETDQYQRHSRLVQDMVFLACTIQNDLEVLYLVDSSSASTRNATRARSDCNEADSLQGVGSSPLYRALHPFSKDTEIHHHHNTNNTNSSNEAETQDAGEGLQGERQPDVIHGVGKVWREVTKLEALGWHEKHPGFVFGETMNKVIRLQQGSWHGQGAKKPTFKGVRVLVVEDDDGCRR